ncbi:YdcF family protein [Verrucomicrobium sp. BvORR106]|uniref:YdcF family protein n=1 Tax=Verrucomicrobium sp. BvORR106 TaxID=1403819 RepID=UPI002240FD26|nr:YdcF family protein [Verrucomicrobium sp. BvORR106]
MFLVRIARSVLKAAIVLVVAISIAWFFREPLLRSCARMWIVDDPVVQADVVVVLGGGRDWRPFAAAELVKSGVAERILVAKTEMLPSERVLALSSESEMNIALLEKLGIPRTQVETFGDSVTSTRDEAEGLRLWITTHYPKSIVVPTDPFHTRRAKWILERQLSSTGVKIYVKAVPHPRYSSDEWWLKEDGFMNFFSEILKSVYYLIRY